MGRRNAERDRRLPTAASPGLERHFAHTLEVVGHGSAQFPVHVLTPRSGARATLFHLHGGTYDTTIDPFHVRWLATLAQRLDARIVLPDYPLAPEFTWRDSYDQVHALAQEWTARTQEEGHPLWLTGDSAGGGYALALAQTMRDSGGPCADRLVLVSPWLDVSCASPGTEEAALDDPWLDLARLKDAGTRWAGFETQRAEVSPLYGELRDLPRTLMFIGTRDLLYPSCVALQAKATAARWELTTSVLEGGIHVYPLLPGIPEARRAIEQVTYFLKS